MTEFSARFSLFPQAEKKSQNSPDSTGNIEVLATEIPNLISYLQSAEQSEDYQGNQVVKIRLAGWNKESKSGKRFQSGKVSPPMANAPAQQQDVESLPF